MVLFLKNKSETFSAFSILFTKVKNQYYTRIKFLRTDYGKEFSISKFKEFYINYGINHQFFISYNPQ